MADSAVLASMTGRGITPVAIVDGGSGTSGVTGNVASGATDSGNPVKVGGVYNSTEPTLTNGQRGDLQIGSTGSLQVTLMGHNATTPLNADATNTDASTVTAQQSVLNVNAVQRIFNGTSLSRASYGLTVSRIMSAGASTNATLAKGAAGVVYRISGLNAAASVRYIKVYNKATAPTVGTDTPILTLACAASAPFSFDLQPGVYFATGIAYALTTGAADADTGALTAADILGLNVVYS